MERSFAALTLRMMKPKPKRLQGRAKAPQAYESHWPSWSCETLERIPDSPGDGPKWLCGADAIRPKDCLVYSVGSNGEFSFELAVKKRWPACEVYTMDPTLNAVRREKAAVLEAAGHFKVVDIGLAGANGTITLGGRQFPVLTLESHVEMLGHRNRRIDVLKVDIEGYEYEAFASLQPGLLDKVGQLQIELHGSSDEKIDSLIAAVHAAGFLMFNKEPNVLGYLLGGACEEFSFIGADHAFHSFRASHPSCR